MSEMRGGINPHRKRLQTALPQCHSAKRMALQDVKAQGVDLNCKIVRLMNQVLPNEYKTS